LFVGIDSASARFININVY